MAICKDCIHNFVCKYGENRANGGYCTGEKCKQYHSADVAPKSEVERLERILESYAFQYGTVTDKQFIIAHERAEVAKEIFEEIEAEITEALKCNYKRRTEYYTKERYNKEDGEFINAVNGKIDALRGVEGFIAELKKKYTEEQR